jgi:hypothetical protein
LAGHFDQGESSPVRERLAGGVVIGGRFWWQESVEGGAEDGGGFGVEVAVEPAAVGDVGQVEAAASARPARTRWEDQRRVEWASLRSQAVIETAPSAANAPEPVPKIGSDKPRRHQYLLRRRPW